MTSSRRAPVYEIADPLDAMEECFRRGWTDGLPVVPPTEERVSAMLDYMGLPPPPCSAMWPARRQVANHLRHLCCGRIVQFHRTWRMIRRLVGMDWSPLPLQPSSPARDRKSTSYHPAASKDGRVYCAAVVLHCCGESPPGLCCPGTPRRPRWQF